MPTGLKLDISSPVDSCAPAVLRTVATALARQHRFSDKEVSEIELAVDEACANVVRHAYRARGSGKTPLPTSRILRVRIVLEEDAMAITVMDNGHGIRTGPPGVATVEEYLERGATGGLGTYIINNFMDEVEYEELEGGRGTVLRMKKFRAQDDSAVVG